MDMHIWLYISILYTVEHKCMCIYIYISATSISKWNMICWERLGYTPSHLPRTSPNFRAFFHEFLLWGMSMVPMAFQGIYDLLSWWFLHIFLINVYPGVKCCSSYLFVAWGMELTPRFFRTTRVLTLPPAVKLPASATTWLHMARSRNQMGIFPASRLNDFQRAHSLEPHWAGGWFFVSE